MESSIEDKLFRSLNERDLYVSMIICEKHGRTGILIGISKEICQKISNGKSLNQHDLSIIIVDYYDENQFLFTDKYLITVQFKEEFGLSDYYRICDEKDDEKFFTLLKSILRTVFEK